MRAWLLAGLVAALVVGGLLWRLDAVAGQRDAAQDLADTNAARVASLITTANLQRQLATELDATVRDYRGQLDAKTQQIDQLERDVTADKPASRLYTKASCVPAPSTGTNQPAPGRTSGGACELEASARPDYFRLARGLEQQYQQIVALQRLVRAYQSQCKIAGS